jgi:hypothetical protein
MSWRDVLPIHPAAKLFPRMTPAELRELGEDIKTNGLQFPITVMTEKCGDEWIYQLLDGRNRLDAIELAGFNTIAAKRSRGRAARRKEGMDCGLDTFLGLPGMNNVKIAINYISPPDDVYAFVASANVHRRHLTVEQKRDLIAKLIKATPEKSDRQIGEMIKADHKTVGAVRAHAEATGEISPVEKRVGKDGKSRKSPSRKPPAHKPRKAKRAKVTEPPPQMGGPEPLRDDIGANSTAEAARLRVRVDELQAEKRRLEIKILGLESEIEELRGKLKAGGDMSIGEFQLAIKKWEETVEVQRGIIARLENENAHLRAGVGALPADDGIPEFLRRAAP